MGSDMEEEFLEWEAELRDVLEKHDAYLKSLQVTH